MAIAGATSTHEILFKSIHSQIACLKYRQN